MTTQTASSTFESPDELLEAVGRDLGTTPWLTVTHGAVDQFNAASSCSPVESGRVPPLMLVALTNHFLPQLLEVRGVSSGVNYGSGHIRFGEPAHIGDRLRAAATITEAVDVPGGVQTTIQIVVEAEGARAPVCEVQSLSRWLRRGG
jgi:acyl dehydratase